MKIESPFAHFCIHHRGRAERCEKGHNPRDFMRPLTDDERERARAAYCGTSDWGSLRRTPCNAHNDVHTCPDFCLPTTEQVEEHQRETEAAVKRMIEQVTTVRPAIMAYVKKRGWSKRFVQDKIPCPMCESGTVHFTYSGHYNGHIHAKCTTEGCAEWME